MSELKEMAITSFEANKMTDGDLYLTNDTAFIILPARVPIPAGMLTQLKEWQIKNIYTNGTGEILEEVVAKEDRRTVSLTGDEAQETQYVRNFYVQTVAKVKDIFDAYRAKRGLPIHEIVDLLREMLQILRDRRRFVLRMSLYRGLCDDYFINHAIQTTFLSLMMGDAVKLPPHRLVDLGMASLLHEIGLLHLPAGLYDKEGPMSVEERRLLSSHVIVGYRNLKEFSLAQDILLGVLQHHEHLDGSGYLQALVGDSISLYAKVICIACAYHAQISDRPYRSAKNEHLSLATMVKDMRRKYDEYLLNCLVSNLSLFPLGSYVRLSDGSVAMVVDNDPENVRFPIVNVIRSAGGSKVGDSPAIQLSKQFYVTAVLNYDEIDDIKS
ncbi:MAG: HD-GYP domain-containing protein [Spirochaetia bacterium]